MAPKTKSNPKGAGRPEAITAQVLTKLETAFKAGATDTEACLLADIDPRTLYRYCEQHPKFSQKKERLKEDTKARAKQVVRMAILNNDPRVATWYLERKAKNEFGASTKLEIPEPVRVYVKDYEYDNKVLDHIDAVTGDGTRKQTDTNNGQPD